jgi:hypothetical protein
MQSRRSFLKVAPTLVTATMLLQSCSSDTGSKSYQIAADNIWRSSSAFDGSKAVINLELVRLAGLAPSSQNTQCWQFGVAGSSILITPDLRCFVSHPH